MTPRVLCLLADGFEEIETITPIDLLRRAGAEVVVASMGDGLDVTGRSAITVRADAMVEDALGTGDFDLLLIPGGPGVAVLREDGRAVGLARDFHAREKTVAAICAAPLILNDAGLLEGRRFTAHFSVHDELPRPLDERVVVDGRLITSRGAGTALEFSLALIATLIGPDEATRVSEAIMA